MDSFTVCVRPSGRPAGYDFLPRFAADVVRGWNGGHETVASGYGDTAEAALLDGLRVLGDVAPDATDVVLAADRVTVRMGDGRTIAPGKAVAL